MEIRLNVGKVFLGAFAIPWWNREMFIRALIIPLILLITLNLSWYFAREHVSEFLNWFLYAIYGVLFAVFAVTCHRLVILDDRSGILQIVTNKLRPVPRFLVWMIVVSISAATAWAALSAAVLNFLIPSIEPESRLLSWTLFATKIPSLYLFARLCLVFPAIAIGRKVSVNWAFNRSKDNGWRLVLVVFTLPWIISQIIDLLYRVNASILETIVLQFIGWILVIVEVSALSLSYIELTKNEVPQLEKVEQGFNPQ